MRNLVCLTVLFLCAVSVVAQDNKEDSTSTKNKVESLGPIRGTLFICGGGARSIIHRKFIDLAIEISANKKPNIVVITTAQGEITQEEAEKHSHVIAFKGILEEENITVLQTMARKTADSENYIAPIKKADAVWMVGGRHRYLAQTYLNTKTLAALRALLDRGGLIGGASAGAQIQSSYMTRGGKKGDLSLFGDRKYQKGFGFITNSAFDVHVSARDRNNDLFKLFDAAPDMFNDKSIDIKTHIGIGIDEMTAIIVRQNQFEVFGKSNVFVFDPYKWKDGVDPFYLTLSQGDSYDIRNREKIIETN